MLGEKFYISLNSLDNKELNSFIRYSKSNFINKKNEITRTIELFKKNKKHFKNLLTNENILFNKIFPEIKIFDRILLKDLFHYSMILFEDFIVYYISKNDKEQRLNILADFYTRKNLQKEALAINTKLYKIILKAKLNYKNYYKIFKLDMNRFEILLNDFNYETFQYAEKALSYLDQYYFLEKIRITQELRTDEIMSNRKYKIILLDEIKKSIKEDNLINKKILFKIYSISSDLYEGILDKKTFFIYKRLVLSNIDKFDFFSKKMFLVNMGNYLSILFNKTADKDLLKEVFENYKNQLHHKTIVENGKIVDANFTQIVNVSLALKEYNWVNKFIEDYGKLLYNNDLVLLNKAMVLYVQKEYDKALDNLLLIDLKTPKISYEAKTLYAKILYLKKEFELLGNHLNTFELYLRRQKGISELIRENNLKFVLYLKRLLKNQVNKSSIKKLRKDLEEDKSVFNRAWLITYVDLLLQ